eukprot:4442262-Amphidinium_carterae.1
MVQCFLDTSGHSEQGRQQQQQFGQHADNQRVLLRVQGLLVIELVSLQPRTLGLGVSLQLFRNAGVLAGGCSSTGKATDANIAAPSS